MLLRDLTIENYRSFDKYRLDNLARVNLLVGDNNCGKTSVLEAVELFCSPSPVIAIKRIARRRGETIPSVGERTVGRSVETVAGFFRDRSVRPGAHFRLTSVDSLVATIDIRTPRQRKLIEDEPVDIFEQRLTLQVHAPRFATPPIQSAPLEPTGAFVATTGYGYSGTVPDSEFPAPSVEFVGPDSATSGESSSRWDRVILGGMKNRVLEAMRILYPSAIDINYLSGSGAASSRSQIVLSLRDDSQPWQFGSLGEGSKRIFAISTALSSCHRGVALLDELDTGLYYSRLADMWRMVIQSAKDLDVQVFATTHSLDCIRGLAEAVRQDESCMPEVAIHSIDRRMKESVRFNAEDLQIVVDQQIEVR